MELTPQQQRDYEDNGFLIFPDLLSRAEVDALLAECGRLQHIETDLIRRERNGAMRTIFRVHEDDGATRSPEFRALTRLPRLMRPVARLLGDERMFVYHTKINLKPAFEGTIWAWHQDYGSWSLDGVPTPNMMTVLVMLDDADELGGALYFVPGSHKLGLIPHIEDKGIGALNQYSVPREPLRRALESTRPVPVVGRAGTVAFFHCNLIHGSGHNMSPRDRRQMYVVYTPTANRPQDVPAPRPDYVRSRNWAPIEMGRDDGILAAARRREAETATAQ
jgi:ectoine hydroxylase